MAGDFVRRIAGGEPIRPSDRLHHEIVSIDLVKPWRARMVVRASRPQVAFVQDDVSPQAPGGQVVRIAAWPRDIGLSDPVPNQLR